MADEWKRERVGLATQDDVFIVYAQAETYRGLAVHRMPGDLDRWTVTHVASGKSLVNAMHDLHDARIAARDLFDTGEEWREISEEEWREEEKRQSAANLERMRLELDSKRRTYTNHLRAHQMKFGRGDV